GGRLRLEIGETLDIGQHQGRELIALDDALQELAAVDPRRARVVELRFFGGLSVKETAEVVHVSGDTVMRDWQVARAWLRKEIARHT
ncbi:MAG TPA: ECF-type sigma factor, partial [Candidatus Sulfopaludibacter sp.]|nr:ECF-type sigma factor [Candidatus Sulfopaludibacter sp.]